MGIYLGNISNIPKQATDAYYGDPISHRIIKGYVGDSSSKARLFFRDDRNTEYILGVDRYMGGMSNPRYYLSEDGFQTYQAIPGVCEYVDQCTYFNGKFYAYSFSFQTSSRVVTQVVMRIDVIDPSTKAVTAEYVFFNPGYSGEPSLYADSSHPLLSSYYLDDNGVLTLILTAPYKYNSSTSSWSPSGNTWAEFSVDLTTMNHVESSPHVYQFSDKFTGIDLYFTMSGHYLGMSPVSKYKSVYYMSGAVQLENFNTWKGSVSGPSSTYSSQDYQSLLPSSNNNIGNSTTDGYIVQTDKRVTVNGCIGLSGLIDMNDFFVDYFDSVTGQYSGRKTDMMYPMCAIQKDGKNGFVGLDGMELAYQIGDQVTKFSYPYDHYYHFYDVINSRKNGVFVCNNGNLINATSETLVIDKTQMPSYFGGIHCLASSNPHGTYLQDVNNNAGTKVLFVRNGHATYYSADQGLTWEYKGDQTIFTSKTSDDKDQDGGYFIWYNNYFYKLQFLERGTSSTLYNVYLDVRRIDDNLNGTRAEWVGTMIKITTTELNWFGNLSINYSNVCYQDNNMIYFVFSTIDRTCYGTIDISSDPITVDAHETSVSYYYQLSSQSGYGSLYTSLMIYKNKFCVNGGSVSNKEATLHRVISDLENPYPIYDVSYYSDASFGVYCKMFGQGRFRSANKNIDTYVTESIRTSNSSYTYHTYGCKFTGDSSNIQLNKSQDYVDLLISSDWAMGINSDFVCDRGNYIYYRLGGAIRRYNKVTGARDYIFTSPSSFARFIIVKDGVLITDKGSAVLAKDDGQTVSSAVGGYTTGLDGFCTNAINSSWTYYN